MPNWIEGSLKVRGKSVDILKFLKEGIGKPGGVLGETKPLDHFIKIEPYSEELQDFYYITFKDNPWIIDTNRAFINDEYYYNDIYLDASPDKEQSILILPIKQAWGFRSEDWKAISKNFNIDIRLFGYERGGEFAQEVEVLDGEVTIDREIHYNDWDWECPFPFMGG